LGDRSHEAVLFWCAAAAAADVGEKELATQNAKRAVQVLWQANDPRADWFDRHLNAFQHERETESAKPSEADQIDPNAAIWFFGGSVEATLDVIDTPEEQEQEPNQLSLALRPTEQMARFIAERFRSVDPDEQRSRLEVCSRCAHYTGLRCRLSASFVEPRARLAHEHCPLGLWTGTSGE